MTKRSTRKPTKKERTPALGYLRKSVLPATNTRKRRAPSNGKPREDRIPSIEEQRRNLRELAKREGCTVIRYYDDPGRKGWRPADQRPGMRSLFDYIEQHPGEIKSLCVDDLDRLSRETTGQAFKSIVWLNERGVEYIHSVNDGSFCIGNLDDPGVMHTLIALIQANHEASKKIARRCAGAIRERIVEQGLRHGGPVPYAMAYGGDGKLKPGDRAEQAIVVEIFERYARGQSLGAIAVELNGRGVESPGGVKWSRQAVANTLDWPGYIGTFARLRWGGGQFARIVDGEVTMTDSRRANKHERRTAFKPVLNAWPAIVDADLYKRVARRRAEKRQAFNRRGKLRSPIEGLVRCGQCGSHARFRETGPQRVGRFTCSGGAGVTKGCRQFQCRESDVLPIVLAAVREKLDEVHEALWPETPGRARKALYRQPGGADRDKRLASLKADHGRERERIKRLVDAMADEDDADLRAILRERIDERKVVLKALADRIDETEQEGDTMTDADRKQLLAWFDERREVVLASWRVPGADIEEHDAMEFKGQPVDVATLNRALQELGVTVRFYNAESRRGGRTVYDCVRVEVSLDGAVIAAHNPHTKPGYCAQVVRNASRPITVRMAAAA